MLTYTFMALSHIQSKSQKVHLSGERETTTTYRCGYSDDVHRTKRQALPTTRHWPVPGDPRASVLLSASEGFLDMSTG